MAQTTEAFLLQQGIEAARIKGWVNVPEGSQQTKLAVCSSPPCPTSGLQLPNAESGARHTADAQAGG